MALNVGDLLVRIRGDTSQFAASMSSVGSSVSRLGANMRQVGSSLNLISVPLAALATGSVAVAKSFDTSMTKIISLVGVARSQVDEWRDAIKPLAPEFGRTSTELADAMFYITSAGLRGTYAFDTLKASAMGAAVGMGDTKLVADAATSAMNAYGKENLDAATAVSQLAMAVRLGKAEADTLAPVIGRLMPITAEMGIEFHEVAGAIAAMTRLGFDAASSVTALRATTVTLLKPTKTAIDLMRSYGWSFKELRRVAAEEGLIPLLVRLKEMFAENSEAMAKIFPNVRALSGVLGLVGKNIEDNVWIMNELKATGPEAMEEMYGETRQSDAHKMRQAIARINTAMLRLGEEVLPIVEPLITDLTKSIGDAAEKFSNMSEENQKLVMKLGAAAIAAGPLLNAMGNLTIVMGMGVIPVMAKVIPAVATVTGAMVALEGVAIALAGALGWVIGSWARETPAFIRLEEHMANAKNTQEEWAAATSGHVGTFQDFIYTMSEMAETAAGLNKDTQTTQEAWDSAVQAAIALRDSLGLMGEEWEINTERTKENAEALEELRPRLIKVAQDKVKLTRALRDMSSASDDAKEKSEGLFEKMLKKGKDALGTINSLVKAHRQYIEGLIEEEDLLTKEDVTKRLHEMVLEYQGLVDAGISQSQIAEKYSSELEKHLKLADEYGIKAPVGIENMAKEMDKFGTTGENTLTKLFEQVGRSGGQAMSMWEGPMVEMYDASGEKLKTSLSGGFGEGIDEGVKYGDQKLNEFIADVGDRMDMVDWSALTKDQAEMVHQTFAQGVLTGVQDGIKNGMTADALQEAASAAGPPELELNITFVADDAQFREMLRAMIINLMQEAGMGI